MTEHDLAECDCEACCSERRRIRKEQLAEWIKTRPPVIQAMAEAAPGWLCFRLEGKGHYEIYSYAESGTVTVTHGRDSFLPGVQVFGIDPAKLERCDCGKWHPASPEQAKMAGEYLDAMRKAHLAGPCDDPLCRLHQRIRGEA